MISKSPTHHVYEGQGLKLDENIRGMLIVALGAAGLIGLAWGVMMVLTSPDGWVTKAANSAVSGGSAQVVAYGQEPAVQ